MKTKLLKLIAISALFIAFAACGSENENDAGIEVTTIAYDAENIGIENFDSDVITFEVISGITIEEHMDHESFQLHDVATSDEWIVFRMPSDGEVRLLNINFHYTVNYDGAWNLERHYHSFFTTARFDVLRGEALVVPMPRVDDAGFAGNSGIYFDGTYYVIVPFSNMLGLREFENIEPNHDQQVTLFNTDETFFIATWLTNEDGHADFLSQFDQYVDYVPTDWPHWWLLLGVIEELSQFSYFWLGQYDDPFVGEEWLPFYIGEMIAQDITILPDMPALLPFSAGGAMPQIGFSLTDADGNVGHYFMLANNASGGFPLIIAPFDLR